MKTSPEHIQSPCAHAPKLDKESKKDEQERTTIKKRLFLNYFENSHGMISPVCKKIEIGRATFYHWFKKDKEFKKKVSAILHARGDVLEDRLFAKAMEGDVSALKFLLQHINSKYKKKKDKSRVDIYHHVGIRPGEQAPITLEDIIDNPDLWGSYLEWQKQQEKKNRK